jgi:hypothetical protein
MAPRQPRGYPFSVLQDFAGKLSRGESLDLNDYELAALALFRAIEKHAGREEARRVFSTLSSSPTRGLLRKVENAEVLDRYDLMEGRQSQGKLAQDLAKEGLRGVVESDSHETQLRRLRKERGQEELHRKVRAELEELRKDNKEMGESVEELAQRLAKERARDILDPAIHEEYIWRVLREQSADTIEAVRSVLEALRSRLKDTE